MRLFVHVVVASSAITCGSEMNLFTVGVEQNITCSGVQQWAQINPILPAGLKFQNGVISGTPTEPSPLVTYTISAGWDSGTVVLGGTLN